MTVVPSPLPFEPRRFRSAAAHYLPGRPAYAPALIRRVAALAGLGAGARVMDLGCGPGQLGRAFAPFAAEVVAIDPEPEMLRLAAEDAPPTMRVQPGSSYDLGPALGRFRLVVIGRAFHWMDRADALARLDGLIEPEGSVALFADRHPPVPDNAWREAWRAVIDTHSSGGDVRNARRSGAWVEHEAVLLDSPFAHVERVAVIERRHTPEEALIQRALSMSGTSPSRIGDRVDALTRELRDVLAPHVREGLVTEVVESTALLAFRHDPTE